MEHQVLVKLVDGRTRCLRFEGSEISCRQIKARVCDEDGIPVALQRIVTGSRQLDDEAVLDRLEDGSLPNCSVLLRLRGGKGGFGSLLRGSATGGRHKKTSNYDACRDINGRRLRHVNAEKKLKEWKAEAEERELEKKALEYLKKDRLQKKSDVAVTEEIKKFREQTEKNMEEVEAAVLDGMNRARKLGTDGKRKKIEMAQPKAKRIRLPMEDDEDDDDDGELFSEPLFGSSSGASSSGSQLLDQVIEEEEDEEEEDVEEPEQESTEMVAAESYEQVTVEAELPKKLVVEASGELLVGPQATNMVAEATNKVESEAPKSPKSVEPEEPPVNLERFSSTKELEALGLEKLKLELQRRGLKCGGSLTERASRLYLLKSTPIDKLDKKHFSAKSK